MDISVSISLIVATLLVSIRLAPLFLFAPVFGSVRLPTHFRVFFVLAFSLLLAYSLSLDEGVEQLLNTSKIVGAMLSELIIGAAMAACVMIGFAAFSFGGRLLDLQMGFGVASLIDSNTRSRSPLIGTALSMMAVTMFYLADFHHTLLLGVAYSFEKLPLAQGFGALNLSFLFSFAGSLFTFGMILVAPVVLVLFLIDVGLALMSRTMPQMNVFALGIALKVFVGMAILALSIRYMGEVTFRLFESLFVVLDGLVS